MTTTPVHRYFTPAPLAAAAALALTLAAGHTPRAHAQVHAQSSTAAAAAPLAFNIPAQPLDRALNELARQANLRMTFPAALVSGKVSHTVSGAMTLHHALQTLLTGTGLTAAVDGSSVLVKPSEPAPATTTDISLPVVNVKAGVERETANGPVRGYVAKRSATATKTDTSITETPQSISVVSAQRMETLGANSLTDVLAYTPNIDVAPYGADSRYDWISIRGFDAYSPGFHLDGLPLRNNAWWAVWQTENYGLERVEIMRGPSSVLYGQNGPGGLVNLVSKRPTAEPLHEIQAQVGTHGRKQLSGDFAGPLNKEGSVLYRLVGLVRDAKLPDGRMADDRFYLAPSLTFKPSPQTDLTFNAHVLRSRAGVYTRTQPEVGSLLQTPAGTRLPTNVAIGEPDFNHLNQDQWSLGYQLVHRVNAVWTVRQNLRYADLDMDYGQVYGNGLVNVNANPVDPANYRVMAREVTGSKEAIRGLAVDNQIQADVSMGQTRHTFLLGLDHQNSRFNQLSYYSGSVSNLDLFNPIYDQAVVPGNTDVDTRTRLVQTGLYAQDQIKWSHWVTTFSARYDRATVRTDDHLSTARSEQTDSHFTGRAGLVYSHPSGWAPYVSYATSFSPVTTLNPDTNRPFDPETGRQLEAGLRFQPSDKATYSAAIFDLRRQNYVSYEQPSFIPKQTGEITVRGLELEAVVTPLPRLNLTASYAYTPKAEVTQSANPTDIGKQATAVPKHRLSLWGDYRLVSGFRWGLGLRHVGSNRGINESAASEVPAYTLVDALLGYDLERWSFALNVQNLTDKVYITGCRSGTCYLGSQRRVQLSAVYRW